MPLIARPGPEGHPDHPIDWAALKREILSRLDVAAEYTALGVEFTRPGPNATGWRECRAFGRPDRNPSAGVNIRSGVYHDFGAGGAKSLNLFEFALAHGGFGRWIEVVRHYAAKAGVELGTVPTHGQGRIREATYLYRDAAGEVRYAVFRYRLPNGRKSFTMHPPDGRGGWKHGPGCMEGIEPLPYRMSELLAADPAETVWIVEGEHDAERLAAEGLIATTGHGGCGATDRIWPRLAEHFRGRACVIIPDRDQAGAVHARKVAGYLRGVAASVKVVDLPGELPPGADVSDWLDAGGTVEELCRMGHAAPEWDPETAEPGDPPPGGEEAPSIDIDPADVVTVCLSDVQATAVQWLWTPCFPLGKISLLAGEAKLGKSFLTLDFAARVSTGGEIPCGKGECMPRGSVLLISGEDDLDDTVKPRLVAAGADTDRVHALTFVRQPDGSLGSFSLEHLIHLEVAIRRLGDTRLVVIDPVTHYVGARIDDHKSAQLRTLLGPLKLLAKRTGVAILILTHTNKTSSPKALNRITGSLAYTAMARANWLVLPDPEDPKRRLMLSAGVNLAEDPPGLAYRIQDNRVEWEPETIPIDANQFLASEHNPPNPAGNASKVEQAEAWLSDVLRNGSVPSDDLMRMGAAKGFGRNVLFDAKARLGIRASKSGFQGKWTWSLPAKEYPSNGHENGGDSLDSLDIPDDF